MKIRQIRRDLRVVDDPEFTGAATEERKRTFVGMNRSHLIRSLTRQSMMRASVCALAFALMIAGSPMLAYLVLAGAVISSLARAVEYSDLD